MAPPGETVAPALDEADVIAPVAVPYQADGFRHSALELLEKLNVALSDGAFVESEDLFQIGWLFLAICISF